MSASLMLERAPPGTPPTVTGGGGGDGDGEGEFLRLLTASETSTVFADWKGRAGIYKLSDTDGISERQSACIQVLEEMEAHRAQETRGSKQLTIGLFDSERVWALSSADVSASGGLVIRSLTVHPMELNNDGSTAALRLLHGLHVLADAIELPLDLQPLEQTGQMGGLMGEGAPLGRSGVDGDVHTDGLL